MVDCAGECLITILVCLILNIIFLILANKNVKFDGNLIINTYKNNWNLSPITDIEVSKNGKCENEYFLYSKYYGSKTFCDCTYSTNKEYKGNIYNDLCEIEQGKANCSIIIKTPEKKLNNWKGKILCIKRINKILNYNYLFYMNIEKSKCDSNQSIIIDTNKTSLCKSDIGILPISYIEILKKDEIPKDINSINISLDENYNLYYSKTYFQGKFLIDIKITQDENGICVNKDEGIFSVNEKICNNKIGSPICKTIINNQKIDNRYYLIDKEPIDSIKFLNDNNINNYPCLDISNKKVHLYGINYYGMNIECIKKLNNLNHMSFGTIIFLLYFAFYFNIFILVTVFFTIPGGPWDKNTKIYFIIIVSIGTIVVIISYIFLKVKISSIKEYNLCFDDILKNDFYGCFDNLEVSKIFCLIIIGIYVLSIFAGIIL